MAAGTAQAGAQPAAASGAHTAYAVLVGSNEGGPGQEPLRYAEADASGVRDVLVELGGIDPDRVTLLRSPDLASLERALAATRRRIERHRQRDEDVELVFYYSGHARAQGLHLGAEELPLDRLRALLSDMGANLTLVLLDACQSGAYARVRGVEPAADFTFNSVERLRTSGLVVMASSSDDELSQESETLRGGFFTHHLIVGLRGAADVDGDGRVTLDEVYRYAYAHTLADTSRTAVGGQHVALETDLTGHGAVPLSFPAEADAHVVLPARLEGRVLIQHLRSGVVVAEVDKASGAALRLGLPAGHYLVLVRGARTMHECDLHLQSGASLPVDLGRCEELDPAEDVRPRGEGAGPLRAPWGIEAAAGMLFHRPDAYVHRLEDFGYQPSYGASSSGQVSLTLERRLPRRMGLLMRAQLLESEEFSRAESTGGLFGESQTDFFSYQAFSFGVAARATQLLRGGRVALYGQLGAGFALGRTVLDGYQSSPSREFHYGYSIEATGGFRWMFVERFGFLCEIGWVYAPVIDNLVGDTHDSGGLSVVLGMRGEVGP